MNATVSPDGRPQDMTAKLEGASTQVVALDFSSDRPVEAGPVVVSPLALLDGSRTVQFDTALALAPANETMVMERQTSSSETQTLVAGVKRSRFRHGVAVLLVALVLGVGLAGVVSRALEDSYEKAPVPTAHIDQEPPAQLESEQPSSSVPRPKASVRAPPLPRSSRKTAPSLLDRRD